METLEFIKENYEVVLESKNICYVKLTEKLINDYLIMINDPSVANQISQ